MFFNIPIRTLLIREGVGEMGIGGGIVWDSTEQGEWDEGLLKARFLTDISAFPLLQE
jgi:anthranilate/para-aminobenzoate synthase component I